MTSRSPTPHLRHLRPFPANLGEVLRRYPQVVCPEMNLGQLALLLRGKYLVDVQSVTKVQGVAFLADEVGRLIRAALGGTLAENRARQDDGREIGGGHGLEQELTDD